MNNRWKNILIGLMVVAAACVIIGLILFLRPTIGDGKQQIKVRFANIAGISKGTRVTYAGRPVGQVTSLEEIPNARNEPTDHLGRVFYYQILLKIDSGVTLYTSDEISICTSGLMGERSVAIIPKTTAPDEPLIKITDQIIYANSVDPIEHTFNQVIAMSSKAGKIIDHIDHWLEQHSATLGQAIFNINSTAASMNHLCQTAEEQNLVSSLKNSLDLVASNLKELQTALGDDQLLTHLGSCINEFHNALAAFNQEGAPALAAMRQIATDIATGSGTLGRILVNDEFYLRMNSLMSKSETLMNDINHYGLLFQYNKQWKKQRTQRANWASSLRSPKDFKEYFESEINEMSSAIGRISEVLNQAEQDEEKIIQSQGFQNDFSVLLRQVKALNDSVQLFNQDLVRRTGQVQSTQ